MSFFNKKVVIYKDTSDSKQYLEQLEQLLPAAAGKVRDQLECDIARTKAGIVGEDRVLFELKNSGMDMYVLQDICLADEDLTAQIDFYVITPKINFMIECKNLYGNIEIDHNGNFIRTFEYKGRKIREGIYSPVTQNERHMQILKNIRAKEASGLAKFTRNRWFDTFFKSLIVLSNPKTVLNDRYAPKEIKSKVIRADQLISTIKKMCSESKEFSSSVKEMENIAENMLKRNVENRKDYLCKYEELKNLVEEQKKVAAQKLLEAQKAEEQKTQQSLNGKVETQSSEEISSASEVNLPKLCPRCGSQLVLRTARKGQNAGNKFWGCSSFPKCRYIQNIRAND